MNGSNVGAEPGRVCVFRDWDENFDIVRGTATFELGLGLHQGNLISLGLWKKKAVEIQHTLSMYSMRDPECDSTKHSTQINGLT